MKAVCIPLPSQMEAQHLAQLADATEAMPFPAMATCLCRPEGRFLPGSCFPDLALVFGPVGLSLLVFAVFVLRLEPLRVSAWRVFFFRACALAGGVPPDMAADVDAFAGMEQQTRPTVHCSACSFSMSKNAAMRTSIEPTRRKINQHHLLSSNNGG